MNYRQKWIKQYGKIPSGYIIHHLNFRHTDDRMNNLILLPSKLHVRFHFLARYFSKEPAHLKEVLHNDKLITEEYLKIMKQCNKNWNKEYIIERLVQSAPQTILNYHSN